MGHRECGHGHDSAPWDCWKAAIVRKTGGFWYSTVSAGYCGPGMTTTADGGPCQWRVETVVKKINKTCSDDRLFTMVETEGQRCFEHCNEPARNVSSPCWIKCFYSTALGPNSGLPNGAPNGGLPISKFLG
jgi:hypothetical protein